MTRFAILLSLVVLAACSRSPDPAPEPSGSSNATPSSAATAPLPAIAFRYTSLEGCRVLRAVPEEGGFYEHECAGEGGWQLRHTEADLREDLTLLAPDGGAHELGLTALADGAFNSTGQQVEWRAPAEGAFAPRALIVRQSVMEDPDPKVPEVSYLVVARLAPRPCVIARVAPGPGQNERARAIADRGGECLSKSA